MSGRRRKHWGWGFEDQQPSAEQLRASAAGLASHLGMALGEVEEPVALESVRLPAPRMQPAGVAGGDLR